MIPPSASLQINPSLAFRAFDEWAALQRVRGKSAEQVLKKLMREWIKIAISMIKAGDAAKIRTDLMQIRRNYKPPQNGVKGPMADKYRGTIAAFIVQKLNWKGANTAKNKRGGSAFYGKVGQFINARVFSRNLHKAGFRPALAALRAPAPPGTRVPNYSKMPGTFKETATDWAATLIAENFASSAKRPGNTKEPLGIEGLAPDALSAAEGELAKKLERWLAADLEAAAAKVGFFAPRRAVA